MKTNISIELNDNDRNHLHNICFSKPGKQMITRKQLTNIVNLFIEQLLKGETPTEVTNNIVQFGYKHYFNDVEVTPEEWKAGIQTWLEKRKRERLR